MDLQRLVTIQKLVMFHLYHHIHGLSYTNGAAAGGQVRVGLSSSFMKCIDGAVDGDQGSVVRRGDPSTQSIEVTYLMGGIFVSLFRCETFHVQYLGDK